MDNRSAWAKKQLKRLFEFEGDALDIVAVHEAALEMSLPSPLEEFQEQREILIDKAVCETSWVGIGTSLKKMEKRIPLSLQRTLSTEGYIYVIKSTDGKYKIGRARDVKHRLNCLQTGTPKKLKLILQIKTSNNNVLEKLCHRKFATKRLRGEWFKLTKEDLNWLKNLPAL